MSRVTDVLSELESIGAVGEKVVLMRMDPPKHTQVEPELHLVPKGIDERLEAQEARFNEERQQWAVLVEIAAAKLEALATEVQGFRNVIEQMNEAIAHKGKVE